MEKGKVLLIDDNLDMLLIGQKIFTRVGYKFISARTGQEGLEKAKHEVPDVIILDYMLPDFSGTQFIKEIAENKAFEKIKNTPIVMLTARTNLIEDLETCFDYGLRAYLLKPFGHRELVNIVDNVIRIERRRRSRLTAKGSESGESKERAPQDRAEPLDVKWFEDIRIAAGTISTLCRDLHLHENENLSEEQILMLQAIHRSSHILAQTIDKKVMQHHELKSKSVLF
jgi:DNA-binding response OmpR family regulator